MDDDVKNYLMNINNLNKPSRKRRHDNKNSTNYEDIKKELYYYCSESLMVELKQIKSINNKNTLSYLNEIIDNYNKIRKQLENKTSDIEVFLNS